MGQLVAGVWQTAPFLGFDAAGRAVRPSGSFCGEVRGDGQPGADGRSFPLQADRYHLVVSLACPFAHRALIGRAVMGLEKAVSVDVVEPRMGELGWHFAAADQVPTPGSSHDRLFGCTQLSQLYVRARADYTGRVSVPVLWDKKTATIVSTESADILRMFGQNFSPLARRDGQLVPAGMLQALDALNAQLQRDINAAVYRCGFAQSQKSYEVAVDALFSALDELDARLGYRRFLLAEAPCEADWRLFATLIRFDWVYALLYRCNTRLLRDYAHLSAYMRDLYQWPGIAATVDEAHIKTNYFCSQKRLNPSGLVPRGFATDFTAEPNRAHLP